MLAIASPWFILVSIRNPDFFAFFFINQNLERYTSSSERYQPFFYFMPVILGGALPWTFLLGSAIKEIWKNKISREVLYIVVWFSLVFLFFTPSRSKLATYVLPCFPPLSLLLGYACKGSPQKGGLPLKLTGILWLCMGVLLVLFPVLQTHGIVHISSQGAIPLIPIGTTAGAILIVATLIGTWLGRKYDNALGVAMMGMVIMILAITFSPRWDSLRTTKSLVQDLPSSAKLYAYRGYCQSSSFYSQRQVGLVESVGELEFGIKHNRGKGVVIKADELAAFMKTDKNVYCLTDKDNLPNLRKIMPAIAVVKQTKDLCLLHIPGP
jgi:4-amino-4-deoxy-L-arabinose transferase-like glycosyltransferase